VLAQYPDVLVMKHLLVVLIPFQPMRLFWKPVHNIAECALLFVQRTFPRAAIPEWDLVQTKAKVGGLQCFT
jgi:hypothetical protein